MFYFIKKFHIKRRLIAWLAGMHFFGNASEKFKLVGVTGTNGKTTTSTLLYWIATELGYKCGLCGTVENIIIKDKIPALMTTPDPIPLNRMLNEMAAKGCEYVFMEVSSHAIEQGRIAGLRFKGGIFTNLTHDHLDYHKTFENYFQAKNKFFRDLPQTAFALSNADAPYGIEMLDGSRAKKYMYGFESQALKVPPDFKGEIKKMDFGGIVLNIGGIEIKTKLLGKFNAYNLLSVWSACELLGFDMEKVQKVMETIEAPRGRFEHFTSASGVLAVVDYAHTPDALEKILNAVSEIKPSGGRIISVFGCGGDRDQSKRKVMGKLGADLSDLAIFTSDNPRSEDPDTILKQMTEDLSPEDKNKVKIISNRREAIQEAARLAKKGDIVLVAGKGHETYQEIKGVKNHFDDMEELKQALV